MEQLIINIHARNNYNIIYHIFDLKIDSELFYKAMKISNLIVFKRNYFNENLEL